jgi:hypothetical protein
LPVDHVLDLPELSAMIRHLGRRMLLVNEVVAPLLLFPLEVICKMKNRYILVNASRGMLSFNGAMESIGHRVDQQSSIDGNPRC